jgi:hypothetical protein
MKLAAMNAPINGAERGRETIVVDRGTGREG